MIQELCIKNFKSVRELNINCKKVNVFIGEPNSGKSNIIEALALQSQNALSFQELNPEIFRYKTIGNLFYDYTINTPIEIITDKHHTVIKYAVREDGAVENCFHYYFDINQTDKKPAQIQHDGKLQTVGQMSLTNVKYYSFKKIKSFKFDYSPFLSVPFGENIPLLLLSNPELKRWVSELFRSFGFKLMLKPTEGDISMSKEINEELYEYPFFNISETLQRLIFYSLTIKSNNNSVLLLDEPESNMFPFYIKDLAERLTEDESNQLFITTHNPYLLGSLLEKQDNSKLAVFIVKMQDYKTTASLCDLDQIQELISLGSGSFFNLDTI